MHKDDDSKRAKRGGRTAARRVALGFGALLALAGCNVGPNYTRPEVKVNDNWTPKSDPRISTQAAVDTAWWKSFQDSTLDKLVELADKQNLPLQVAALRIVESRAQFALATGKQFPQEQVLFANATALGLTQQQANALGGIQRNFGTFQIGFDAVWELDFWGKYRRGVEAEAASLLGSVTDYYYALVSLTAEVARTYVTIRTYEVLIDQALENTKVQEQGLEIADSRFKHGATSELDVAQATSLLETTRASIPQLQIRLQQVQNSLATLLGQSPGTVASLLAGPKAIPKTPSQVAVSVPAEMLRRRPDIRSAELSAAAQCARIGVAKADLYPSFSIAGTIGLQTATIGGGAESVGGALAYSVGPKITWPFFNYGRLKNNVRVQDARFQELLVSYRNTVLKAAQEVEDALSGFINSQEAMTFEQRAVQAAQRSVEISLSQYREGAADYQRVLDAQRSLLQQQNSLAQTNSDVATNLIAVYKALGGGWEVRAGQPYIPEATRKEMNERTDWSDMLTDPRSPEENNGAMPESQKKPAPPANKNPPTAPATNKSPAPETKNPAPETNKNPSPAKQ